MRQLHSQMAATIAKSYYQELCSNDQQNTEEFKNLSGLVQQWSTQFSGSFGSGSGSGSGTNSNGDKRPYP
jgi:hypothetical protein